MLLGGAACYLAVTPPASARPPQSPADKIEATANRVGNFLYRTARKLEEPVPNREVRTTRTQRIYTVTTTHAIHLGAERRANPDRVTTWDEYELCGFLRAIVKNYTLPGVVVWVPLSSLWILWKTARKYWDTGHASVLVAYGRSAVRFFRDLRSTMEERARTQASRRVRDDVFRRVVFKAQALRA